MALEASTRELLAVFLGGDVLRGSRPKNRRAFGSVVFG